MPVISRFHTSCPYNQKMKTKKEIKQRLKELKAYENAGGFSTSLIIERQILEKELKNERKK